MPTTMGIKLDDETRRRLEQLGRARDRSPHWLMKRAIAEYLDREETYESEKREDLSRWEAYQATGEHLTNAEMNAWLDDLEG